MVDTIAVPVEPTEAMIEASLAYDHSATTRGHNTFIYRAMIAAAPKPSEQADPAPSVVDCWDRAGNEMVKLRHEYREGFVRYDDHARIVAEKDALMNEAATLLIAAEARADALAGVLRECSVALPNGSLRNRIDALLSEAGK